VNRRQLAFDVRSRRDSHAAFVPRIAPVMARELRSLVPVIGIEEEGSIVTPDGRWLLTAHEDGNVRVWTRDLDQFIAMSGRSIGRTLRVRRPARTCRWIRHPFNRSAHFALSGPAEQQDMAVGIDDLEAAQAAWGSRRGALNCTPRLEYLRARPSGSGADT
jgi:hypothetical protein